MYLTFIAYLIINIIMDITEYIRICLVKKKISISQLAEMTEQSQPNLSTKLKRNNFYTNELEKIANAMNCRLEVRFVDNDSNQEL